jgi:hypothetical protein
MLLEYGADVNQSASDGQSPLFIASSKGQTDVVALLKANGADLTTTQFMGLSPADAAQTMHQAETLIALEASSGAGQGEGGEMAETAEGSWVSRGAPSDVSSWLLSSAEGVRSSTTSSISNHSSISNRSDVSVGAHQPPTIDEAQPSLLSGGDSPSFSSLFASGQSADESSSNERGGTSL